MSTRSISERLHNLIEGNLKRKTNRILPVESFPKQDVLLLPADHGAANRVWQSLTEIYSDLSATKLYASQEPKTADKFATWQIEEKFAFFRGQMAEIWP